MIRGLNYIKIPIPKYKVVKKAGTKSEKMARNSLGRLEKLWEIKE